MKIKTVLLSVTAVTLLGIATIFAAPASALSPGDGNGRGPGNIEGMTKNCDQAQKAMFSQDGETGRMGMMGRMMGGGRGYHDNDGHRTDGHTGPANMGRPNMEDTK